MMWVITTGGRNWLASRSCLAEVFWEFFLADIIFKWRASQSRRDVSEGRISWHIVGPRQLMNAPWRWSDVGRGEKGNNLGQREKYDQKQRGLQGIYQEVTLLFLSLLFFCVCVWFGFIITGIQGEKWLRKLDGARLWRACVFFGGWEKPLKGFDWPMIGS